MTAIESNFQYGVFVILQIDSDWCALSEIDVIVDGSKGGGIILVILIDDGESE